MTDRHIEINDTNITQWVERFLDGDTTCAEEQELYRYFTQPEIPVEVEKYREMFTWYNSLNPDVQTISSDRETTTNSKVSILRLRPWQWISAAAAIALLFTLGFIFRPTQPVGLSEEYLAYKGSYIIRDGKKITDLAIVVPEIIRREKMIDERLNAIDRTFDQTDKVMINTLEANVDMTNPAVREAIQVALEY